MLLVWLTVSISSFISILTFLLLVLSIINVKNKIYAKIKGLTELTSLMEQKLAFQTIPEASLQLLALKFKFSLATVNVEQKTFKSHLNREEGAKPTQGKDDKFAKPVDVFVEVSNKENYMTITGEANENVFEKKEKQ